MIKIFALNIKDKEKNAGTAFLKKILATECNTFPENLIIDKTEKGKPFLTNFPLKFNLSHSGDWVAVAISEKEIGIDIEKLRNRNYEAILSKYFDKAERNFILAKPKESQLEEFIALWTLKEAFLKCIGTGIAENISKYPIIIKDTEIIVENHTGNPVHFKQFQFLKDYKLSVCGEENDFCTEIVFVN